MTSQITQKGKFQNQNSQAGAKGIFLQGLRDIKKTTSAPPDYIAWERSPNNMEKSNVANQWSYPEP